MGRLNLGPSDANRTPYKPVYLRYRILRDGLGDQLGPVWGSDPGSDPGSRSRVSPEAEIPDISDLRIY